MKIGSLSVVPSLICPGTPLDGLRIGAVMKIVDSDASVYVNFVIQTREGPRYCAQMDARRRRNRNALLRMALESGRTVMLISGINSYVRTAVIGMDPHMLASDSGLH